MNAPVPALRVEDLSVAVEARQGLLGGKRLRPILKAVGFALWPGEVLAIVGESGSGKSVLLRALLKLLSAQPGVVSGRVDYQLKDAGAVSLYGEALGHAKALAKQERAFARLRGSAIGLLLQSGKTALNPRWTVGWHLGLAMSRAGGFADAPSGAPSDARAQADWLAKLGFQAPSALLSRRPHELSGGMAQRVMLAVVLARRPEMLFLDEVTTGIDVRLQAEMLRFLSELHQSEGFSALFVTHDLGVARQLSDRVLIMKAGEVVEQAQTSNLFSGIGVTRAYTQRLMQLGHHSVVEQIEASQRPEVLPVPELVSELPGAVTEAPEAAPLLEGRALSKRFGGLQALSAVNVTLRPGIALALVGESGSGKTTLARILTGLLAPDSGELRFEGEVMTPATRTLTARFRRSRALLFQDPYASLNPELTPEASLIEGYRLHQGLSLREAKREARLALESLGLASRAKDPLYKLSGGERRRVSLMRCLSSQKRIYLLDEPTAGLDAEHREGVAARIREARDKDPALSLLVVSHNLSFVLGVADEVMVMQKGACLEQLSVAAFSRQDGAKHPYTRSLWQASSYVAGVGPPPAEL